MNDLVSALNRVLAGTPYTSHRGVGDKYLVPESAIRDAIQRLEADAARIEELEAQVREAALALAHLERCAHVVSERGATTGPQWTRLTTAILMARGVIKRLPPPAQTEPRMVQSEEQP